MSARNQPTSWQEVDQLAHQIAGNTALLGRVDEAFSRFPGLNIKVLRRLDYFDHEGRLQRERSMIFRMDKERLGRDLHRHLPDTPDAVALLQPGKKLLLEQYIDQGDARSFGTLYEHPSAKPLEKFAPYTDRKASAVVFDFTDMATRQEFLSAFAQIDSSYLKANPQYTLAEANAFVRGHEAQHARSSQLWRSDPEFLNPDVQSDIEKLSPGFSFLKRKACEANGEDQFYLSYLDEQMSDTVATLQHIKNGGTVALPQDVSDARASGYMAKISPIYYSTTVIDRIIEQQDIIRKHLEGLELHELDSLAAYLVGTESWGRDQFYENAIAAQHGTLHAMQVSGKFSAEQIAAEQQRVKNGVGQLLDMYSADETQRSAALKNAEARFAPLSQRAVEGKMRLMPPGQTLAAFDHLVEIRAAIAYNQAQHPEFNTPQGALHLLQVRERYLAHTKGPAYVDREASLLETLKHRYEFEQGTAPEVAPQQQQEVGHGRS